MDKARKLVKKHDCNVPGISFRLLCRWSCHDWIRTHVYEHYPRNLELLSVSYNERAFHSFVYPLTHWSHHQWMLLDRREF